MKTDKNIIRNLNGILSNSLVTINQFFLHARMFKNWGFNALNSAAYEQSIKAMKEADTLIERILFLEGVPNLQKLKRLNLGKEPQEMLRSDLDLQKNCRTELREGITRLEQASDYCSREVLQSILHSCEDHIDWLEAQLDLIQSVGIQNYLQSQIDQK